jgi:hypothetical protein
MQSDGLILILKIIFQAGVQLHKYKEKAPKIHAMLPQCGLPQAPSTSAATLI